MTNCNDNNACTYDFCTPETGNHIFFYFFALI
jgi:hypothetical protein